MRRHKTTTKRVHSLLDQYGGRIPQEARIAAVDIDDPYGIAADAVASLGAPPAGSEQLEGAVRSWYAPRPPRIRVVAALRDDVVAKMFARRQLDKASFLAARDYQALAEVSESGRLRGLDLTSPPVSGRGHNNGAGIDAQHRATVALSRINNQLGRQHGGEGLWLVRDILVHGLTVEAAARKRGATTKQHTGFWGALFRQCLRCLAVMLGYASASYARRRGQQTP